MKKIINIGLVFLCLGTASASAEDNQDVSLRFHAQWKVGEKDRERLKEKFGLTPVKFDPQGHAIPINLPKEKRKQWERIYELCMRDGCYYCDAPEGSCEEGTCGPKNSFCKPYTTSDGKPKCGQECAEYAFTSTLL